MISCLTPVHNLCRCMYADTILWLQMTSPSGQPFLYSLVQFCTMGGLGDTSSILSISESFEPKNRKLWFYWGGWQNHSWPRPVTSWSHCYLTATSWCCCFRQRSQIVCFQLSFEALLIFSWLWMITLKAQKISTTTLIWFLLTKCKCKKWWQTVCLEQI